MKLKSLTRTKYQPQWVGTTIDGKNFYARYRYGELLIIIGAEDIISREYGDEFDGSMTTEEMLRLAGIEVVS